MNSSQFKKNEFKKLCAILGFSHVYVRDIVGNIDGHYDEWFEKKMNKATGDYKRYKDGTIKERAIRPPLQKLKAIQSAIKKKILEPIPLPPNIHGGVKHRSNVSNAKPHQGNKFKFATDLQDFYPSITSKQVYETFVVLGFSHHQASWLAKLTTWKYEVPQGAPTSTHIANLVSLNVDQRLIAFCEKHGLTYTRYIDDLTFSSQLDFKHLLNEILDIITSTGYKISFRKTSYAGYQTITGISVFNNYIDAPKKVIEKAKEEILLADNLKPYSRYLNTIRRTNTNMRPPKK